MPVLQKIEITEELISDMLWDLYNLKNEYVDVQREIISHSKIDEQERNAISANLIKWFTDTANRQVTLNDEESLERQYLAVEMEVLEYGKKLHAYREQLNILELQNYPAAERNATGFGKALMAFLIGASTVLAIVLVGTGLHLAILAGLSFGAIAYAVKAIRDVYKRNQEEKVLTKALHNELQELKSVFGESGSFSRCAIEDTFKMAMYGILLDGQPEILYHKLVTLRNDLELTFPGKEQKLDIKNFIEEKISKLDEKFPTFREVEKKKAAEKLHAINQAAATHHTGGPWLWTKIKQAGNRTLCFMGGAAAAASVGVGLAIVLFGVTNPAGWVLLGILAASVAVGAVAVGIDYFASRRQDRKIQALNDKTKEFVRVKSSVDAAIASINLIHAAAVDSHKKVNARELELKLEYQQQLRDQLHGEEEKIALKDKIHADEMAALRRETDAFMLGAKQEHRAELARGCVKEVVVPEKGDVVLKMDDSLNNTLGFVAK